LTSSSSSWGSLTLFIWNEGHISSHVVNVTRIDLDPLATSFELQVGLFAVCVNRCPWLLLQYRRHRLLW
jgi:hypothetical protein